MTKDDEYNEVLQKENAQVENGVEYSSKNISTLNEQENIDAANKDTDITNTEDVMNIAISELTNLNDICKQIIEFLDFHKAENIIFYEFPKYRINFEKLITCRVTSGRRAARLGENLMQYLKERNISSMISNLADPEWVVVFNTDIFAIHIFTETGAEYFKLNELLESRKEKQQSEGQ